MFMAVVSEHRLLILYALAVIGFQFVLILNGRSAVDFDLCYRQHLPSYGFSELSYFSYLLIHQLLNFFSYYFLHYFCVLCSECIFSMYRVFHEITPFI